MFDESSYDEARARHARLEAKDKGACDLASVSAAAEAVRVGSAKRRMRSCWLTT